MKIQKSLTMMLAALCLLLVGAVSFTSPVYAKKVTTLKQAAKMALKEVKNGNITDVDKDYQKGQLVYEVQLVKKTKEYEIVYRASDGKILSYSWDDNNIGSGRGKKTISKSKCRRLAKKEVPGGTFVSLVRKYDDGMLVYKVKMQKNNKQYSLKYHAKTAKLLEYEWKLNVAGTGKSAGGSSYIGIAKAKQIALSKAPGATVVKAEFDMDDKIPVYEVKLIKGVTEYDITIDAKTGKVLEIDRDYIDD